VIVKLSLILLDSCLLLFAASQLQLNWATPTAGAAITQEAANLAGQGPSPRHAGGGIAQPIPLSRCETIKASGQYYLKNDVTCTSLGFAINADNVKLDLNGHTIIYGIREKVVPAISICDRWFKPLADVPCGDGVHNHPEIYNGRIVQAKGSHPFTHAVWIGQANGAGSGWIHNLVITIQETGTQAIHGEYQTGSWRIENNTVNDNVTNIEHVGQGVLGARSNFQGYAISLDSGSNAMGKGNIISGNKIIGSPQGGIFDSSQHTKIFGNEVHLSSYYSNDYGIIVTADDQNVSNNFVDGRGRGIDAESSHFVISKNRIHTHEEPNNTEYHGCELNGTYGIRVKNYKGEPPSKGWTIEGNTVQVESAGCGARAMQFTDLGAQVDGVVRSNSFQANAGKLPDYSIGFTGVQQPRIDFIKNTLTASSCVLVGNDGSTDGASVLIQAGQIWNCSQNTVHDTDLTKSDGQSYPQSVTILDALPNPRVLCGVYSSGTIRIGSFTRQCGK
jgi:hypothetical protein